MAQSKAAPAPSGGGGSIPNSVKFLFGGKRSENLQTKLIKCDQNFKIGTKFCKFCNSRVVWNGSYAICTTAGFS